MKLKKVKEIADAEVLCCQDQLEMEVEMVCGSDLMSDVLAFIKSGSLLMTGLTNAQVVRTSEMAEIVAICFVRGKRPQQETIDLATEKKLPLLATKLSMFESCGRLYRKGLRGCDETG